MRDAEEREDMAMNIPFSDARAEESQRVLGLQRLQDENTELVRTASLRTKWRRVQGHCHGGGHLAPHNTVVELGQPLDERFEETR
jgi:hypothetical protein